MNTITKQEIKVGTFNPSYPISKLKHSTVNRDIVDNHAQHFQKKIERFGWLVPVVIDHRGNIIEGHHRVVMAYNAGHKTVPVYIIDWVDTSNLDEYQQYIISLNNANRKWTAFDYLKTFARNRADYSFVFKQYNKTKDVFSVSNLLNIYFNTGCNGMYKDGLATIKNMAFSDYLFRKFYELKSHYGGVKIQAFTVNRVCSFAHQKIKGNLKEMKYIFDQLEQLAENDSAVLSSVEHIRPFINKQLELYRDIAND